MALERRHTTDPKRRAMQQRRNHSMISWLLLRWPKTVALKAEPALRICINNLYYVLYHRMVQQLL